MKPKYKVDWYEYNLTQLRSRNFFTLVGAMIYQWYLLHINGEISYIYEYEQN